MIDKLPEVVNDGSFDYFNRMTINKLVDVVNRLEEKLETYIDETDGYLARKESQEWLNKAKPECPQINPCNPYSPHKSYNQPECPQSPDGKHKWQETFNTYKLFCEICGEEQS